MLKALKPGLLDVVALITVAIAIGLPAQATQIDSGLAFSKQAADFDPSKTASSLDALEHAIQEDPANAAALAELTRTLSSLGHYDQALRVARKGAEHKSPSQWRSRLVLSGVLAERIDIEGAHESARSALTQCQNQPVHCPPTERVRIELYLEELDAGLKAIAAGMEPKEDPKALEEAMSKAHRTLVMPKLGP